MPEVRYYEVEQTRVVKVAANDESGALAVANQAFKVHDQNANVAHIDEWGHSVGRVEIRNINIARETI